MQFTPNIWERYAATLRNLITRRLIKGENIPKNFRLLKIILVFSALVRCESKESIKLYKNLEKLLNYAAKKISAKGISLKYSINEKQNYIIDYNLLKLLVLELVANPTQNTVKLEIKFLKERMIFTVQNATASKILKRLAKKLNTILIKTRGESNFAIMLPAPCVLTLENSVEDSEDYENLFSSVNIMLFG